MNHTQSHVNYLPQFTIEQLHIAVDIQPCGRYVRLTLWESDPRSYVGWSLEYTRRFSNAADGLLALEGWLAIRYGPWFDSNAFRRYSRHLLHVCL